MPTQTNSGSPTLLAKAGIAAAALVAIAGLIAWPMYQVTQHREHVTVSFKGILLAAFLAGAAANMLLPPGVAIPWKKSPEDPLNGLQKIMVGVITGGALLTVALVWWFFSAHGYTMKM